MFDVIVIGGGPAGSYTAKKLAEKGHKVIVLERKRQVGDSVCCTGIIGQECVDTFAVDESVILRHVNSARLFSPSGNCLSLRREKPQACIIDRAAFDISLAKQAQDAGADYVLNGMANDIVVENDGVRIEASHAGRQKKYEARAVVIAAGFSSGLHNKLGLSRFGDFTIGAQAEVKTTEIDQVEVYFNREVAPDFFAWLVPTMASTARVGLMTRKHPGSYLKSWLVSLAAQGRITSPDVKINYGGIPIKPLARTCGDRLIVVGDAAGQVKPTSAGGIYFGLLCADIAARTLHQALDDGDLSAKRMMQYERRWRKKLGRELRIGYWARRMYERLSDRQVDRIFEAVKANGIDEALLKAENLSFDWHSKTIMSLVKYQIVSRTMGLLKLPFRTG